MSDLIERITKCSGSEKRDMEGNPDPDGYRSGMWITAEDADEILTALHTLQRIESAKIILIEWDEEVKIWRVNTYTSEGWQSGKTLAAAVEAAGKKGEGR